VDCNSETGSDPAARKIVTVTDSLGLESFTISRSLPISLLQATSSSNSLLSSRQRALGRHALAESAAEEGIE
jgi:hypothetical protein